jgi:hypothetical protein
MAIHTSGFVGASGLSGLTPSFTSVECRVPFELLNPKSASVCWGRNSVGQHRSTLQIAKSKLPSSMAEFVSVNAWVGDIYHWGSRRSWKLSAREAKLTIGFRSQYVSEVAEKRPLRRQPDDHHFWSLVMLAVTAGGFLTKALFSSFKRLQCLEPNWQRHILVSHGYLELGMFDDTALVLEETPEDKTRNEVLGARVDI